MPRQGRGKIAAPASSAADERQHAGLHPAATTTGGIDALVRERPCALLTCAMTAYERQRTDDDRRMRLTAGRRQGSLRAVGGIGWR